MSLHSTKRPYVLADVEPVIAVAEATRWERDNDNNAQPRPVLLVANRMVEARRLRSAHQRELMLRFVAMIGSWFCVARASRAPAKVPAVARRGQVTDPN